MRVLAEASTIDTVLSWGSGQVGFRLDALVAVGLALLAAGSVLVADRPPPLRRFRRAVFPAVVVSGALASLGLLITLVVRADFETAVALGVVCVLFAAAAISRVAATQTRHQGVLRRLRVAQHNWRRLRR